MDEQKAKVGWGYSFKFLEFLVGVEKRGEDGYSLVQNILRISIFILRIDGICSA